MAPLHKDHRTSLGVRPENKLTTLRRSRRGEGAGQLGLYEVKKGRSAKKRQGP